MQDNTQRANEVFFLCVNDYYDIYLYSVPTNSAFFYNIQCTTQYFEGMIALIEVQGSWVAKWQRMGQNFPGEYILA